MPTSLIPPIWQLPEAIRKRLGATAGKQRAMIADGHLLLILHKPPSVDQETREGRLFWRQPDGTWQSSDLGGGPAALGKHLAAYAAAIDRCDEMENKATTADEYFQVLEELAPLRRATANLHQVLQDAREKVREDTSLIEHRDRAYDLERTAELQYAQAKNSLDLVVARRAEDQARSAQQMSIAAHKLNLLVAFFFPIATLTGIFSSNFRTGIEDHWQPLPFLALISVGLIAGLFLLLFVGKPPRK